MAKKRSLSKKDKADLKRAALRTVRAFKAGIITSAQLEQARALYYASDWQAIWDSACRVEGVRWAMGEIPF
jgi:hypothetical protein